MNRSASQLFAVVVLSYFAVQLRAEDQFSIYGGTAQTHPSDVRVMVPPAFTDLTFARVDWRTDASSTPWYYGFRYTHYFDVWPELGISIDLTHNKMYANLGGAYPVSGFRNGIPVAGAERLSTTFDDLALSHGLNTLTIGPMFRVGLCPDEYGVSLVQPYVGVGIGVARPHVEVRVIGTPTDEHYRWGGLAYQAQAGINVRITEHCSIFAEFKVVCVPNLDVDIFAGTMRTKALSHQFLIGPTFSW